MIKKIKDLDGEEWRPIPYPNENSNISWCSNYGRFKYKLPDGSEEFYTRSASRNNTNIIYHDIHLKNLSNDFKWQGRVEKIRTSRILAKVWLCPELPLQTGSRGNKLVVGHLKGHFKTSEWEPEVEYIENLTVQTQSENIRYSRTNEHKEFGYPERKCFAFNPDTNDIRIYNTTADLVRDLTNKTKNGYNNGYFSFARRNNTRIHGYYVGYVNEKKVYNVKRKK